MRDSELNVAPFAAWGEQMRLEIGGGTIAAAEAGPISRMVWDFIWLRVC